MGSYSIGELAIGEGIPKICAPVVGRNIDEIIEQAKNISSKKVDVTEWRIDWLDGVLPKESGDAIDEQLIYKAITSIKAATDSMPFLMTFRTAREGGVRDVSPTDYARLYEAAIASKAVDLIDIELAFCLEYADILCPLIASAHENHVGVVMSSHDFNATPDSDEMIKRLTKMDELGADILKIAVMPKNNKDVVRLLDVTARVSDITDKPLITMAMGGLGLISRLSGEVFGSALTFGAVTKASAPGQIAVDKLSQILEEIHCNLTI